MKNIALIFSLLKAVKMLKFDPDHLKTKICASM